ncbi:SGNH/GDSL hydrolase family protein [Microvirga arabica]|uniref:SGNH/GDSL hydrolase family protein n=1 Tax=Microvirga arabica TaxID=1128671 RepID=UPI00193A7E81|nr:SGNH/GDSL hydrolase family protein [Microvirga arabica]MBM1175345.1 SGNH/GDSL hydrolase family protein [Microvirga arabica]
MAHPTASISTELTLMADGGLNLVIAGDSNGTDDYSGKDPWIGLNLGQPYELDNNSVSGITLDTQANANLSANLADYKVGADNVLIVQAGANDLRADLPAASVYADAMKLVAEAEAKGFDTVIATELPKSPTKGNWDASDEVERIAYNKLVRGNKAGTDAVADVAADPVMGAASAPDNETLYVDGVHVSASANTQYLQPIYSNAILKALNAAPTPSRSRVSPSLRRTLARARTPLQ